MSVQPLEEVVIDNSPTQIVPFNTSCYICYDEDNLIKSPCVCNDLYVHANCLKEWIMRRINITDNLKCSLCKSTYDTQKISNEATNQELINCINQESQNNNERYAIHDRYEEYYEVCLPMLGTVLVIPVRRITYRGMLYKACMLWSIYILCLTVYIFLAGFMTYEVFYNGKTMTEPGNILMMIGYGVIHLLIGILLVYSCRFICRCQ